ncbi:hypothetical protein CEP54_015793 [Fusarium duplospermum]|uniref:Uncharacterized protein n=1 Tax=Fusarium duplospermum TaxID=1325734 RepID=A0A428NL36_9HYPO|nr:hypothetical protein CEP54_015793 [Fusarium duplospermum]
MRHPFPPRFSAPRGGIGRPLAPRSPLVSPGKKKRQGNPSGPFLLRRQYAGKQTPYVYARSPGQHWAHRPSRICHGNDYFRGPANNARSNNQSR